MAEKLIKLLKRIDTWSDKKVRITFPNELLDRVPSFRKDDRKNMGFTFDDEHTSSISASLIFVSSSLITFNMNDLLTIFSAALENDNCSNSEKEKIRKLYEISEKFKAGGYPKIISHEWHMEVIDDEGHVAKVIEKVNEAIKIILSDYNTYLNDEATKNKKLSKESKAEAIDLLDSI